LTDEAISPATRFLVSLHSDKQVDSWQVDQWPYSSQGRTGHMIVIYPKGFTPITAGPEESADVQEARAELNSIDLQIAAAERNGDKSLLEVLGIARIDAGNRLGAALATQAASQQRIPEASVVNSDYFSPTSDVPEVSRPAVPPANPALAESRSPIANLEYSSPGPDSPTLPRTGLEENQAFVREIIDIGKLSQLLDAGEAGSALVLPVVSLSSRNDLYLQDGLQRPADLPVTVRVEPLPDQLADARDLLRKEVVQDSDLIVLNANIVGDRASWWIPKLDTHPGVIRMTPEQSVSARTEDLAAAAAWSRLVGKVVNYGSLRITYVTIGDATYAVVRSA